MEIVTRLLQHMSRTLQAVTAELDGKAAKNGLDGTGLLYVVRVCEAPGLSQDRLAEQLGVDRSTVTRRLTELERLGYIERSRNAADRRQLLVRPTDKAFELLPWAVELLDDVQAGLTRGMSREEIELLEELIGRTAYNAARMRAAHDYDEA